jgi:hypothetical protein
MSKLSANKTGDDLAYCVESILRNADYEEVESHHLFAMRGLRQSIYAKEVEIGRDIYNKTRRCDFMLLNPSKFPNGLVIECKWQASRGSVEEKYPFLVLSIQINEYPTIIVLDGGGYTKGAKQWLIGQSGKNNLKHVFDQGEFQRYVSKGNI